MADTVVAPGAGSLLGFDLVTLPDGTTAVLVARTKVGFGIDGVYADVTDANGLPTRPRLPVPDQVVASGSIDPTTLNSLFSVTPNGNGTVVLKIGTLGTAFPGGTVVSFEKVGVPGAAPIAINVYPRGAANSGRIKTTTVGGEFIFPADGAVSVQARVSTVGTGVALPVVVQLAAPPAVQPMVPVNVGQTTRAYDRANKQRLTTSATDAVSAAITASEIMLHARGSAMWIDINTAAIAASAPFCLEAGERFHLQINPGDIVHAIQDTAGGVLVISPVL